ncbi:MAG: hypothetical protein QM500_15590 [Methylococcales bacterium]
MKNTLVKLLLVLSVSVTMLVGCGGGSDAPAQNSTGQSNPNNAGKKMPDWVPVRTNFFNVDGTLSSCIRISIDSDGFQLSSTASNPVSFGDSVACTDDDKNTTFSEYTYDLSRSSFSTSSQSTFDPAAACQDVILSSKNVPTKITNYISGSNNFICSTSTGIQFSYQISTLDEDLYETLSVFYSGAGADATWETSDDAIQARFVSTWSADRLTKTTNIYMGAGTDSTWGTSDDVLMNTITFVFSQDLIPDHSFNVSPGADGIAGNDDDIVLSYALFNYTDGNIDSQTVYSSAGLDGVWETIDDNLKQLTVLY